MRTFPLILLLSLFIGSSFTILQQDSPLIDTHNGYPWQVWKNAAGDLQKLDLRQTQPAIQTSIPRLKAGEVEAEFWTAYVPPTTPGPEALRSAMEQIDIVDQMMTRYPDTFQSASTAEDIDHIFKAGKIASLIALEGGSALDGSLAILRTFYKLGVRSLTPSTERCDAPLPHKGLGPFGESVVREMNWLGMMADLSHASNESIVDVLKVTKAPVIFSHGSDCREIPDDILQKVRDNGGVIAVSFGIAAPEEINHLKKVAGIDHIAIGASFDDPEAASTRTGDPSKFPTLTAELLRQGYSGDDVKKLMGLNVLRAMREVERVSDKLHGRE